MLHWYIYITKLIRMCPGSSSYQSIGPVRKKLTPPKSFLEDLTMEVEMSCQLLFVPITVMLCTPTQSGSPRRELTRSTSVGSSLCEEITVIFMNPHLYYNTPLADTAVGLETSSPLVGGIILVGPSVNLLHTFRGDPV